MQKKLTIKSSTFRAINLIGDYWLLLLMREALLGATRYTEFYKRLAITHDTLSDRLKRLVDGGLLSKTTNTNNVNGPEIYRLNDMGRDLYVVLIMIRQWHRLHPELFGADWVRGTFEHNTCRHTFEPHLVCNKCGVAVHADDVTSRPGTGAGTEHMTTPPTQRQVKIRSTGSDRSTSGIIGIESDRWAIMIMAACFSGISRFKGFRERLLISPHTLSNRLNLLCDHGLISRQTYCTTPKRYEYIVTAKGKDIYPILVSLMQFGDKWLTKDGPPMLLQHNCCQDSLLAVLQCEHCKASVELEEIRFTGAKHTS